MTIAVISTFPSVMFEVYAKEFLQSFVKYWPADIPILVQLDDDLVVDQVKKILRPQDGIAIGWEKDHKEFVERNKDKDDPQDYRKQPVRFCHKVFAIKRALDAIQAAKNNNEPTARYLIWMDADVHMNKPVTMADIKECLPKEGDAVAYMGRKDWPHSECGWLAFDLENSGDSFIEDWVSSYTTDLIFKEEQWHDSWIFDRERKSRELEESLSDLPRSSGFTNLTADKPGMDIWPHSPMGKWSTHFKGPQAKQKLVGQEIQPQQRMSNVVIQTRNAIPHEEICNNIRTNQLLIKNWITKCEKNDEEIVIVSAGPMLIAEDVREEVKAGRKIVAVKHALDPLEKAGIVPWACILLDPREHVSKFVEDPDTRVLWLVATQVNPEVTKRLLEAGCEVWGYHASVGANEESLTAKQPNSVIAGGSATATRGMYMLSHLGFNSFRLYGYDLCYSDKPKDMGQRDDKGQPKYLDVSIGFNHPQFNMKHNFFTEPQFVAQFEEINEIIRVGKFKIKAFGMGMIPFIMKAKETGELREREIRAKLSPGKLPNYERLFKCSKKKKTLFSMKPLRKLLPSLLKPIRNSN